VQQKGALSGRQPAGGVMCREPVEGARGRRHRSGSGGQAGIVRLLGESAGPPTGESAPVFTTLGLAGCLGMLSLPCQLPGHAAYVVFDSPRRLDFTSP
jgi:hypothetical protein